MIFCDDFGNAIDNNFGNGFGNISLVINYGDNSGNIVETSKHFTIGYMVIFEKN